MDASEPTRPPLVARRITSIDTHDLRSRVLRPGCPVSDCMFPGDDEPLTIHAAACLGERIVSIASMYHERRADDAPGGAPCRADHAAGGAWRLRGMATEPELRRRGGGTTALDRCIRHALDNEATLAWCNARIEAVDFYLEHGWLTLGDEFDIPTVGPHVVMERRLT